MSFLDTLTVDQKEILISLPYRAGLWISQSDDTGGQSADEEELQVLSNILNGFAEEVFGSEAVQYIMSEAVSGKEQWPLWAEKTPSVLSDCVKAIDILAEHADQKDVNAFRNHIMEIGQAVALAFREYDQTGAGDRLALSVLYFLEKVTAIVMRKPYTSSQDFFNISPRERKALNDLAQALGTQYSS